MRSDPSVAADPAGGAIRVGRTRVAASPAGIAGELRIGGDDGPVLRPLRFGERTSLVLAASAQANATDAVASAVLAAATVLSGAGERILLETLALWMAGAAFDGPSFIETALIVGRAGNWALEELMAGRAEDVDRMAIGLSEQQRGGEWKTLLFLPAPEDDVASIRRRFTDQLLRRSASSDVAARERAVSTRSRHHAAIAAEAGRGTRLRAESSAEPRPETRFDVESDAEVRHESAASVSSAASRHSSMPVDLPESAGNEPYAHVDESLEVAGAREAGGAPMQFLAGGQRLEVAGAREVAVAPPFIQAGHPAAERAFESEREQMVSPRAVDELERTALARLDHRVSSHSGPSTNFGSAWEPEPGSVFPPHDSGRAAAAAMRSRGAEQLQSQSMSDLLSVPSLTQLPSAEPGHTAQWPLAQSLHTFAVPRLFVTEGFPSAQNPRQALDEHDLVRRLAQLLDDEADLRGVES